MPSRRLLATLRRAALGLAAAALALLLAVPALGAGRSVEGLPAGSSLLFALSSKSGTLTPAAKHDAHHRDRYGLTLRGVDPDVTWFADRPRRDAGRLSAGALFGGWGQLGFRHDPPNGALVVSGAKPGEDTMAVELKLRRYDARQRIAHFSVRGIGSLGGGLRHLNRRLDQRVPARFSNASLFVDNGAYSPGCILGQSRLMAIVPGVLEEHPYPGVGGMRPAEGQELSTTVDQELYALIGNSFGGNAPTSFALPSLPSPGQRSGAAWYFCTAGLYPTEELGPGVPGEIVFWPSYAASRSNGEWLPADGRTETSVQYPTYAADYAGSAATFTLPKVTAPPGMTAMVCMESRFVPEALLTQISLFVGPPVDPDGTNWLPAEGQTVPAESVVELSEGMTGGRPPAYGEDVTLPSVPSPAPGTQYYVAASGTWPFYRVY